MAAPTPPEVDALVEGIVLLLSAAQQAAEDLGDRLAGHAPHDADVEYQLCRFCILEEAAKRVAVLAEVAAEELDVRQPDRTAALVPQVLQAVRDLLPPRLG